MEMYMKRAMELAKKGEDKVAPNPLVGCVIVKNNKIIGEGYHQQYGGPHAEVNAVNNAQEEIEGSDIYVTLEPCAHHGKTPPCANLLVSLKPKKVYIALEDPHDVVAGKGIKLLKEAGIEVEVGLCQKEAIEINKDFLSALIRKRPYLIMKSGMSLDGKIATKNLESKWITSSDSRQKVQEIRNKVMAVMVGSNTVVCDNPSLNPRIEPFNKPYKIVIDSKLVIPKDSQLLEDEKLIIITTKDYDLNKYNLIKDKTTIIIQDKKGHVNIKKGLRQLTKEFNINSILVEAGSEIAWALLEENIVDEINYFIAPIIIGGNESKSVVGGSGIDKLQDKFKFKNLNYQKVGNDILIKGERCSQDWLKKLEK